MTLLRSRTTALGLGLVALHLLVTFRVRPHPRWNDGIFVLNRARDFPDVPLDHHSLRIGNLIPVRAFLEVFGYGQWAYYAWPFLTGILLVVAVFALGVVLFDRWTAAAATVLLILHPVLVDTVIRYGTERMTSWQLLPDIPAAAFLTLGFALLIHAAERDRGAPWFLWAGFCFGWAYLVRELSVFLFPVLLGVLIAWRLPWRRWVQVAAPMLGCLALELVFSAWAHGDPLARLKVGSQHGSAPPSPITRLDAALRFPRIVEVYPGTTLVLTTLALTALGALVVRRRAHVFLLAWFVAVWLPLTAVSGLLDPGFIRINASLMRYWVPVLPALVLGAAGFAAWLLRQLRVGRLVVAGVAALGLVVALLPVAPILAHHRRDHAWNAVRAYLQEHDREISRLVTDDRDALILGIYTREPVGGEQVVHARVSTLGHSLPQPPSADQVPGAYLIWTPTLSKRKPRPENGWRLVLKERQLRVYAPAA